jgi:hypothetical protein
MKDQYFGDVNDFRKYGLLRALQAQAPDATTLVAWMLTRADGTKDGGSRSYLKKPHKFKRFDEELFDWLNELFNPPNKKRPLRPHVSLLESSGLLKGTTYYSAVVPDKQPERTVWRQGLLKAARKADFVFLDPDNGTEVPSKPVGRKDSSKYIMWQEIGGLWDAGCSLIIYQHYPHERRAAVTTKLVNKLFACTGARPVAVHTSHAVFLLVPQRRHSPLLGKLLSSLWKKWSGQFELHR